MSRFDFDFIPRVEFDVSVSSDAMRWRPEDDKQSNTLYTYPNVIHAPQIDEVAWTVDDEDEYPNTMEEM
jgi:hypothetical protein